MMRPQPRATIPGRTAWLHNSAPRRLTSMPRHHLSRGVSQKGPNGSTTPALLTSTSTDPRRCAMALRALVTPRGSVTSAENATASPPATRIRCVVSSRSAAERAITATLAPEAASVCAMARPMPRPPPVTTATLPCRRPTWGLPGAAPDFMEPSYHGEHKAKSARLRRQTRALPSPDDYRSAQDGAYQQVKQCPKPCRECCRSTERSTHVMVRCSNRARLVIPIHVRGCEEDKRGHQKGHGLMPRPSVGYIADALRQDKDHGRKDNDSSRFDKFHFSGPICVKPFRRNHPAYKLAAVGRSPKVIRSVCPRPHQIRICSASE